MNSYYALVNLNSDSVNKNIKQIEASIKKLSQKLNAQIDYDYDKITPSKYESWENIETQFHNAKKHTHLFVFGGDGTQTYILNLIAKNNIDIIYIGFSCGTMNIGSFSNRLNDIDNFQQIHCYYQDAIISNINGNKTSLSFIDSVITTTCVSRIDGLISQFSAKDILKGIKKQSYPDIIGNKHTIVEVVKNGESIFLPTFKETYTISVAFLSNALKAQVMAGGADPASCIGFKWGIIISDFPLIWADPKKKDLQLKPIHSVFFPLEEDDLVKISKLNKNAHLINDGNAISNIKDVEFRYISNCSPIYKLI